MNIAVVLVHNKTDQENFDQIETLKSFIVKKTKIVTRFDDSLNQSIDEEVYWYELKGLPITHEAKFYQILPFGVTQPSNFYDIDSHNVLYRAGDEDKTGDHPRFFNWGLKRGTDYGADIVIGIRDITQISSVKVRNALDKFTNDTEFVESTFGVLASKRLLKLIGQLKEGMTFTQAVTDLKQRVVSGGLKNG